MLDLLGSDAFQRFNWRILKSLSSFVISTKQRRVYSMIKEKKLISCKCVFLKLFNVHVLGNWDTKKHPWILIVCIYRLTICSMNKVNGQTLTMHKHCLNLHAVYVGTIWFMDFSRNQSINWVNDFSPQKRPVGLVFWCVYLSSESAKQQYLLFIHWMLTK